MKTDDLLAIVLLLMILGLVLNISNLDIWNSIIYFVTAVTVALIYSNRKRKKK